jgi:hypothetical protein
MSAKRTVRRRPLPPLVVLDHECRGVAIATERVDETTLAYRCVQCNTVATGPDPKTRRP